MSRVEPTVGTGARVARPAAYDVIVVGSGLGGLTAAAYLAANRQRVLLLERYSVLGGSSHVFRRKGGWEFDVGVHYIDNAGPGGDMPRVLGGLGLAEKIEFLALDETGFDTILAPDFELRVPRGLDAYLANLVAAFPGEEKALRRFMRLVRAAGPVTDRSAPDFGTVRGTARGAAAAGLAAPMLVAPYPVVMAACGMSPRAILVLSPHSAVFGTPPTRLPFAMYAGFLHAYVGGGAWYPRGGGQVFAANLAGVVRTHGGAIRTGAEVARILVDGGRVAGVQLADGETLRAPAVVSDVDVKRTMMDLVGPEHLPRRTALRARSWKMSWPYLTSYFGLARDLRGAVNTNYYVIPSWDDAASLARLSRLFPEMVTRAHRRERAAWLEDFARRMPVFVQSATLRDPDSPHGAPPGHAVVEAMTEVPRDPAFWGIEGHSVTGYRRASAYREMKQRLTEILLARVERAFPGARDQVVWSEAATPATQTRYTAAGGGNIYGLESRLSQIGPLRPGSRTSIRGLFIAGTSTAWGPATTGSMLSGVHAASAVLGRDLAAEVAAGAVYTDPKRLTDSGGPGWDPLALTRDIRPERSTPANSAGPAGVEENVDADPIHLTATPPARQ